MSTPPQPDSARPPVAGIATPEEVLLFWFHANPPSDAPALAAQQQWFTKSAPFDRQIHTRFGATIEAALAGQLDDWAHESLGWLALVVVLDQFTRNSFRGTARSFAGDVQARSFALQGLARGWERELGWMARPFVLLPLEHAEDLALQDECVAHFELLNAEARAESAAPEVLQTLASNLAYAERHRDVIRRFGRFPHRNAILGRLSTPQEQAYLAQPGAGF